MKAKGYEPPAPGVEELAEKMFAPGFANVQFERMTFGIVALHLGRVLPVK